MLGWSWTTRPGWAQTPELPAPRRAEDTGEGLPAPASLSLGDKAPNLALASPSTPLNTIFPSRVRKVLTVGACAGTFSTPSLPGNSRRAGKRELLQAAQQPRAPHDSCETPQGKAVPAGPGGSGGGEPPNDAQQIPVVPSKETSVSHRSDPAHVFLSELCSCLGALGVI